jgi:hypothetical protein
MGALVAVSVSACASTGISAFTGATDSTTLIFICLGGERLTVESYKAFVRGKVPSKFFIRTVALSQSPATSWRVLMAEDIDARRPSVAFAERT